MKVVIFCGGQGMRMRDFDERVPKPLVPIGPRPVLWHVMKYYAHHGHTDFVLCLGYGARQIKEYFLDYKEWLSNDFVLEQGGDDVRMLSRDVQDWRITFVDTGLHSLIGERLRRVRPHLEGCGTFLANYADCLTDAPLDEVVAAHRAHGAIASMVAVAPTRSFHVVDVDDTGRVSRVGPVNNAGMWINGGYMVLEECIFEHLEPGEELVEEPFNRLAAKGLLHAYRHTGQWIGIDTFKERQQVEEMYLQGKPFWAKWHDADIEGPC